MDNKKLARELIRLAKSIIAKDTSEDIAEDVVNRMVEKHMNFNKAFESVGYGDLADKIKHGDLPEGWNSFTTERKVKELSKAIQAVM